MLFMFVTQINSQESVKGLREGAFSFIIHASTPKNGNKKNQFPGLLPIIETGQPTPSATPGLAFFAGRAFIKWKAPASGRGATPAEVVGARFSASHAEDGRETSQVRNDEVHTGNTV